jgi:hypothetical protein
LLMNEEDIINHGEPQPHSIPANCTPPHALPPRSHVISSKKASNNRIKKPRQISSYEFPLPYQYDFNDMSDLCEEWFAGGWTTMKSTHGWGYLRGNRKTLSDWVYLRPDVAFARQNDGLDTNTILARGVRGVHFFFDRVEAHEYFKTCFTYNQQSIIPPPRFPAIVEERENNDGK